MSRYNPWSGRWSPYRIVQSPANVNYKTSVEEKSRRDARFLSDAWGAAKSAGSFLHDHTVVGGAGCWGACVGAQYHRGVVSFQFGGIGFGGLGDLVASIV